MILFGGFIVVQIISHGLISNKKIPVKCKSVMSAIPFKATLKNTAQRLNLAKNKTELR